MSSKVKVGDYVVSQYHPEYGVGMVFETQPHWVSVVFENGSRVGGGPSTFDPLPAIPTPASDCMKIFAQRQAAEAKIGIGGAPTRATTLPTEARERKKYPVASGFMDYFPDAICAIANLSWVGNEQHNPGQPLHWARGKSQDEADTMLRHFMQRGTLDTDGVRHTAKMAWRALALLQKEIESSAAGVGVQPPPSSVPLHAVQGQRQQPTRPDQPSVVQ